MRLSRHSVPLLSLVFASNVGAQVAASQSAPLAPPRIMHAARKSGDIKLDGRLDEPAWNASEASGDFTQSYRRASRLHRGRPRSARCWCGHRHLLRLGPPHHRLVPRSTNGISLFDHAAWRAEERLHVQRRPRRSQPGCRVGSRNEDRRRGVRGGTARSSRASATSMASWICTRRSASS